MQTGARFDRQRQRGQRVVIGQRVANRRVDLLEHQQHAVGLVDFAATPSRQQVASGTVVRRPQCGHGSVSDRLRQFCAVYDVGQQQNSQFTHRVVS